MSLSYLMEKNEFKELFKFPINPSENIISIAISFDADLGGGADLARFGN
jgi:hypothetical protein